MTAPAQISPEVFPVVLGSVLIIASVVFTAFTIWVVFGKWRDNHRKLNKVDENLTERLEWVYGRSNEESSGEFDSFEEGEEKAILAWKGLSCSYPSKVCVNEIEPLYHFECYDNDLFLVVARNREAAISQLFLMSLGI